MLSTRVYGKRKIEREHYRLFYKNISGFRNVRNFLIVQSLYHSNLRGIDNDAERSGFAKYKLHIYDKHHTIFTTQYTNSLAFLDITI